MKKMMIILFPILISSTVNAANTLVCKGTALKLNSSLDISLNEGQGMHPINLGNDRTLDVSFFGDEVRFTELRQPTQEERDAEAAKNNNGDGPYLAGIIIAYSQVKSNGQVTLADFRTEDVFLSCDLK